MEPSVLDDVIHRLQEVGTRPGKGVQLSESEVRQLCIVSRQIFLQQPNLLELEAPIKVCGDIHGQYPDLLRLFAYGGLPPDVSYLFMGNYVDYGKQSLETVCLLLAFKIKYPENFFLLRGNHEIASINRIYGFYDECKRRYNVRLWKVFVDCFNCLPPAALIDEKILCVHGGLSPDLYNLDQIRNLPRPTDVPDTGLLCDLLFSDPSREIRGWGMNDRGVSYTFGPDKVSAFLVRHDLDLICRSNQVVEDGYEFFADRQLVTVFSAPNFRGEYDNAGAMMSIDETLMCNFQILKPGDKKPNFNHPSTNSSKFPSGPIFGSAATPKPRNTLNGLDSIAEEPSYIRTDADKSVRSRRGPSVGSTATVKPENDWTGVKPSSNGTSVSKPGSTPTDVNNRARPSPRSTRYSSPGGARALGEYVGQSAKAVTRAVSPFNPGRDGRRW